VRRHRPAVSLVDTRTDLTPPEPPHRPPAGPDGPQPWLWPLVVAACLLVLTAGAIVGMVTTDDSGGQAATPPPATDATASPTALPPTVSVGPVTDGSETGLTDTTIEPLPPVEPATPTQASDIWPAGQSGYTVVLASASESAGRTQADAAAERAVQAGLAEVGVLRSSDYSSLRPGYWVTYSGIYDTEAEARAALSSAQGAGFSDAYPRRVSP
jgi:hypothetical protein